MASIFKLKPDFNKCLPEQVEAFTDNELTTSAKADNLSRLEENPTLRNDEEDRTNPQIVVDLPPDSNILASLYLSAKMRKIDEEFLVKTLSLDLEVCDDMPKAKNQQPSVKLSTRATSP